MATLLAGREVAQRSFDPRLPMRPDLVRYAVRLAPGLHRNTVATITITSLRPGAVRCGEEDGQLIYHCLDTRQPVLQRWPPKRRCWPAHS